MDVVTAGLIGGALVAFIQGGFNYLDKRKAAPELTDLELQKIRATQESASDGKMLDFWLQQVQKVEDKQTTELNGIRSSFEAEKLQLQQIHMKDIETVRQENLSGKATSDLIVASLQTELRAVVQQRGVDLLSGETRIRDLQENFYKQVLAIEREKNDFMVTLIARFETFCLGYGGQSNDLNKFATTNSTTAIATASDTTGDTNT